MTEEDAAGPAAGPERDGQLPTPRHVAVADVTFEAHGDNLSDLFRGPRPRDVRHDGRSRPREAGRGVVVELTHETLDGLLFDWLDELIGRKDCPRRLRAQTPSGARLKISTTSSTNATNAARFS